MAIIQKDTAFSGKIRMSFQNALVKEDGPILTARLGTDRSRPSVFNYVSECFSISATVRKNDQKTVCQDAAIVFVSNEHLALGIFDGYGPDGTIVSENMADRVLDILVREQIGRLIPPAFRMLQFSNDRRRTNAPIHLLYA